MRRLKTIYAITGGQVENNGKQKDDFNSKKSALIQQLHNFDKLIEARDRSGLATDSRDYIRLKNQISGELGRLEGAVKDLAETHKKEVQKRGCVFERSCNRVTAESLLVTWARSRSDVCCFPSRSKKMTADEINARKDVIENVVLEFHSAFKAAKGFTHRGAEENLGGGVGKYQALRVQWKERGLHSDSRALSYNCRTSTMQA